MDGLCHLTGVGDKGFGSGCGGDVGCGVVLVEVVIKRVLPRLLR